MKDRVAFLGAGSHSDAVKPYLDETNYEFIGYFDDKNIEEYRGYPILGKISDVLLFLEGGRVDKVFVTIGDNRKRKEIFDMVYDKYPNKFINIISPLAIINSIESIKGIGIFIGSRSFIGSEVEIYNNSIINTGSIVEHHTVIANHCNVTPGAVLNFCKLGEGAYVGSGAIVTQLVEIAPYTILGAGAVVVKTIEESGTYVGVPARKIK